MRPLYILALVAIALPLLIIDLPIAYIHDLLSLGHGRLLDKIKSLSGKD